MSEPLPLQQCEFLQLFYVLNLNLKDLEKLKNPRSEFLVFDGVILPLFDKARQ